MTINKEVATIVVEIVGVVVSAIVAPTVGWLIKICLDNGNRLTRLELSTSNQSADYEAYKSQNQDHPGRLAKIEDAILGINSSLTRNDKQFEAIMDRLGELPRLAALLDNYSSLFQMVVPRNEVDSRVKALEDRLVRVESDVRDGKR